MVIGALSVTAWAREQLCYLKLYNVMMKHVDEYFGWLSRRLTVLSSSKHLPERLFE